MVRISLQSNAESGTQLPEETPYMAYANPVSCTEAKVNQGSRQ
jgi:hypothetical protein